QLAITNPAVVSVFVATSAVGGNDEEEDETYRERIRLYGLASGTTGPSGQYESKAKNVSSEILDAKAVCSSAGNVGVYLILESSTGAEAILQDVRNALNATNIRPLTDTVTVSEAEEIPYTLNVEYLAEDGANITAAISAAMNEYKDWQDNTIGRAFNPDHLMAAIYQAGATRVVWGEGSNFNNGDVEYTTIDATKRCKGTITLAVITP
ncbi:MAG: baseplate J/gp47 family protein, partial [Eubacteriales bacterium]|nr:baseplate J/gp47 family protein [Eubacteriales bacterium]